MFNRDQWLEQATDLTRAFLAHLRAGSKFTAPEVTRSAYDRGLPVPPEPRLWGVVLLRLRKSGAIRGVGYALRMPDSKYGSSTTNPHPGRLWEVA